MTEIAEYLERTETEVREKAAELGIFLNDCLLSAGASFFHFAVHQTTLRLRGGASFSASVRLSLKAGSGRLTTIFSFSRPMMPTPKASWLRGNSNVKRLGFGQAPFLCYAEVRGKHTGEPQ